MITRILFFISALLFLQTANAQEKLLYSTNFQDWTSFTSTTEVTVAKKTEYSNEDLVFKFYQVNVDSAGENPLRFNYNVVSKGWAQAQKIPGSYIETSPLKSITKVQFIQGATGTNRGFKLWKKGLLDLLWVPVYTTPCATPAGEVVTVLINETNVAIKFTNIDDAQNAYMFDLKIFGNYVSTMPQRKLDVAPNIPEAGIIIKTPNNDTYDEGTVVKLEAKRNFGYTFVKWMDTLGNVLSTTNPYNVTVDTDKKIIAVFDTITTYACNVTIAGSKWAEVQLSPQPVNGKYETGTLVTMKAIPNAVANFSRWEDNTTTLQRTITVNANKSFTATFDEIPFIVGWNFKAPSPLVSRTGDFYSETTNIGMISAHDPNGSPVSWAANTLMLSPAHPGIRFNTPAAEFKTKRRYLQADFSALNYKNIKVTSLVSAISQAYSVQVLQYSLDNVNFTELARVDITSVYNANWKTLSATLPVEAEGKKRVYIRWVADTTSQILGSSTTTDGTSFANVFVHADKYTPVDTTASILFATEPLNGSKTAAINGTIALNFNETMKAGSGSIKLGSTVLSGTFGPRTVSFNYEKLNYNSQYTVTVPAGALTDLAGNPFPGTTFTFNTSVRSQPTKKLFDAVVAQDGSGDYLSVALAVAAAPINRTAPWLIYIKNGKYTGHIDILSNKPFIHLIGQSRDSVIISDNRLAGEDGNQTTPTFPVQQGATVWVNAPDCYFENLTIENSYGFEKQSGPQALALFSDCDRFTTNNVWLRSYQDTWLTTYGRVSNRHYVKNSKIEGAVDFIYGGGDVFFDKSTITVTRKDGGFIVAPSHLSGTLWGYVFSHCTIDEAHASGVTTYYGRPWAQSPKTVFLYTTLKANIYPKGWYYKMGAIPAVFADYGTMDASGNMVDLSYRIEDYEYNKTDSSGNIITIKGKAKSSLTDAEAATYTYDNVVIRTGSKWDPRMLTEAPEKPGKVLLKGSTLSWNDVPYSRLYIVFRNGKVLDFTTNATYTDSSANGNTYTYAVQAVSDYGALSAMTNAVDDTVPPVVKVKNITVALDSSGKVSITADMVDNGSYDESGIDTLTLDKYDFDCSNIGDNQVTLTVTDKKGNVASAIAIVTVKDTIAPVAITQNVTVHLEADGKASVAAASINNGSYDACGIKSITLSKTDFDCSNVGTNTVTLTVTDNNDNVSTASAIVTIKDTIAPVAMTQDVTVQLNAEGKALIEASAINNGSHDACGIKSINLSKTDFDCSNVGTNTVILTVTDNHDNVLTTSAIVTVEDKIAPLVLVKNIEVSLTKGSVVIKPSDIDAGSSDACGIDTLYLDKTSFDCSNVGGNEVRLTVKDKNGNISSATAVVTVKDDIAPVAIARNATIQLDADGRGSISAASINNDSYDACGIKSIVLSKTDFDCSNVGTNTVILTVTDNHDNVSTASAIVTVEDKISPVVRVKNVELNLMNGSAVLNPSDIDNGSTDACGISSMTASRTSFDCRSIGDHTVTFTVTDKNGNSSSASAVVTIKGSIPAPTIAISRKDTTYTGTSSNTILLGYGAQSLTLTATDKSAAELKSFIWSPSTGLTSTTSANPEFKPTQAGTYTFHVEAFNSNGCSASASVIVNVVDVRCGDMKDKVFVCHYGQVICINSVDAHSHLVHGCKLGSCGTAATARMNTETVESNTELGPNNIKVYPVPASGVLNVQFVLGAQVDYVVELYGLNGALIKTFDRGHVHRSTIYTRAYDISRLPAGAYMLRLSTNKEISTKKIIIK